LKLERERAALVVVDVQEAFRPVVSDFDRVAANIAVLIQGARILGVPVLPTEQYPKGLGHTVPEVAKHLDGVEPIEKVCFSAADAEEFCERLRASGREQILLCGIESHVCVSQTADDLLTDGVEVHVARDGVASRTEENRELGLHKMEQAGAVITSVEAALFELLRAAGTPEFKEVQRLVK
jgi:nicotinamidase-related amidase